MDTNQVLQVCGLSLKLEAATHRTCSTSLFTPRRTHMHVASLVYHNVNVYLVRVNLSMQCSWDYTRK